MPNPPLEPESVIDAAWGLSLYFSVDEREKRYGEYSKEHWDKLVESCSVDPKGKRYFDNVSAVMSGTIYNLALLRQEKSQAFGFYDSLQEKKLKHLDDLAKLSRDAESIFTRIMGLSFGAGLSSIGLAVSAFGTSQIGFAILGAAGFYILFEIMLRLFRYFNAPRIMKDIQDKKAEFMKSHYKIKSEEYLKRLLEKIGSISEKVYGDEFKIQPDRIDSLATGSAAVQSGSHYMSGSIPPTYPYYGGIVGSGYSGGAFDTHASTKLLRTNYERKSADKKETETK